MRIHVQLIPDEPPEAVFRLADSAREAGIENLWVADSHVIWRDCMVLLGGLVARHPDCTFGTAVSNFRTRTVDGYASAMATVAQSVEGRVLCGVGLGDSAVATTGRHPSPVNQFVDDVGRLRATLEGTGEVPLGWSTSPLPILVGASGPRMLDVAGRYGDGAIVLVGSEPNRVRAALDIVRRSRVAAGRADGHGPIIAWLAVSIDDDPAHALDAVRSHAARALTHALPTPLDEEEQRVADAVRAAYDYREHVGRSAPHAGLLPDHIVARFALAGSAEDCVTRLRELSDVGVQDVGLLPVGAGRLETMARLGSEVLPLLPGMASAC